MKHATVVMFIAAALALGACDKKPAPTTKADTVGGLPPAATTPGTPPAGTPPGTVTQPTSAQPATGTTAAPSTLTPRNFKLGSAIGADKKVTVVTDTIAAKEPAQISVDLYGVGEAKVRTQWNQKGADGKVTPLKSDSETVKVTAPTTVAFKAENLAPGAYDVELFVNEVSAGKMPFTVK
jgi:hypothetical protein